MKNWDYGPKMILSFLVAIAGSVVICGVNYIQPYEECVKQQHAAHKRADVRERVEQSADV